MGAGLRHRSGRGGILRSVLSRILDSGGYRHNQVSLDLFARLWSGHCHPGRGQSLRLGGRASTDILKSADLWSVELQ